MALTPEIVQALRAPFPAQQIKWKIQTNPRTGDDWAMVVAYVDARDVAERLDLVTRGDWSDDFAPPVTTAGVHISLMCILTVCGVTRCDVGTVARPDKSDATKDLHSDAFKRAAVKFGVAAHVYRFPNVQALVKAHSYGQRTIYRLTKAAEAQLDQLTQQLLTGTPLTSNAFSDLRVWGSTAGADGQPLALPPEPEEQPNTAPRTSRQNGTSTAARPPANDTQSVATRPANGTRSAPVRSTNGANGTHAATRAPSPTRLASAREALRQAEEATGVAKAAPATGGATDKQRRLIQRRIGDLRVDDATIQGLITTFSQKLRMDVTHLFDDPDFIMELEVSVPQASWLIDNLRALGNHQ